MGGALEGTTKNVCVDKSKAKAVSDGTTKFADVQILSGKSFKGVKCKV